MSTSPKSNQTTGLTDKAHIEPSQGEAVNVSHNGTSGQIPQGMQERATAIIQESWAEAIQRQEEESKTDMVVHSGQEDYKNNGEESEDELPPLIKVEDHEHEQSRDEEEGPLTK